MSTTGKVYLTVTVVAAVLLLALWLQPRVERQLAPRPAAAYVAIETAGTAAVVGPVEIPASEPFRLHAVLEATARDGESVYYTEAQALEIGGRTVPPDRLRRWDDGGQLVRLLWFTVEPWARFLELSPDQGLDQVRFQEFFHPEWPMQWTVEGRLDARSDDPVERSVAGSRRFGTQRYQVWIELHADERSLMPTARFRSWGVGELEARVDEFPTVTAMLPGAAGVSSSVFGLTGVAPPDDAPAALLEEIPVRAEKRLLFSERWLLREILRSTGRELDSVDWRRVELALGPRWTEQVAPGDLLRVGARWVVAYRDFDGDGVLSPADLCFDFEKGAAVRRLDDVFVGDGEIDWAALAI